MANTNVNSSWEKIQNGVKDTERLIGQKDYNSSMIKARQTLEFMVKLLAERAGLTETNDLMATIDSLYQNRWINKSTCEHYHKIRMLGNKAAHEGDSNAYNANQAYHALSQEVYTFARDYRNAQRGSSPARRSSSVSPSRTTRSRKRSTQKRAAFTFYDLLKILIPVLCLVLLVLVIRLVKPFDKKNDTTTAPVTTEAMTEAPTTEAATEAVMVVYKTTTTVNVRSQPDTNTTRIAKLESGVTVEYVRAHDADWAIILYNGQEAYVSSQYLTTE